MVLWGVVMAKRIKTFDWLLIGVSVLAVLVFAFIFFRKSSNITVTVKVGDESVFYPSWSGWEDTAGTKTWFASLFHKGQVEKDGLGRVKAEVLNVYSYDSVPNRKTVYLTVKLNVIYNRASNSYTYKGIPVLIGSDIKLVLDRVYAQGVVTDMEGLTGGRVTKKLILETQLREETGVYLETSGTKAYIAEAINVGDEVKDNKGLTLLKVISKRVVPAQKTVTTSDGRVIAQNDPLRKDVYLTLEVSALQIGNEFFFLGDIPILIDRGIPINTSTLCIFPTITKITIPGGNE